MKIVLIRHGETRGNRLRRYIGSTDEPLCGDIAAGLKYPDAERIIASPLKRCVMTAELIYPERDIELCPGLRETDFGDFENKSYEELKDDPAYRAWLASGGTLPFPNGESRDDFVNRVIEAYDNIIKNTVSKSIAIITHGGTIMAIMQHLFGGGFYDYQISNLDGYIIDSDLKKFKKIVTVQPKTDRQ